MKAGGGVSACLPPLPSGCVPYQGGGRRRKEENQWRGVRAFLLVHIFQPLCHGSHVLSVRLCCLCIPCRLSSLPSCYMIISCHLLSDTSLTTRQEERKKSCVLEEGTLAAAAAALVSCYQYHISPSCLLPPSSCSCHTSCLPASLSSFTCTRLLSTWVLISLPYPMHTCCALLWHCHHRHMY